MRTVIPIILLFFTLPPTTLAQKADTRYTLRYTGKDQVEVELRMAPLEADSTRFTYGMPPFGGQADIFKGVSGIRVEKAAGIRIDDAARAITVFHRGRKPFVLHYVITDTHTPAMAVRGESFRPLISPEYFFSHGINIFMVPAFRDDKLRSTLSLEWSNGFPFPLFMGYDPRSRSGKLIAPCNEEFLFSPMTGATNMSVDTVRVGSSTGYVVLRNYPGNPMTREAVSDYFRKYYTAINAYWAEAGGEYFALILHPFLAANNNISGVAYNTGFVGRYKRDTTFNTDQVFVLSHEIGHHWLGQGLTIGMTDQWFGEGFNDYVSFCILLSSGIVNRQQFTNKMNEAFSKLYASPVRNTPNDSVFANYWKMGDYNRLPYWRGSIFAFWLDNAIRRHTNDKKNLRDLMLALLPQRKAVDGERRITREQFLASSSAWVPVNELNDAFNRYIEHGDPIHFTPGELMPYFRVDDPGGKPILSISDTLTFDGSFTGSIMTH